MHLPVGCVWSRAECNMYYHGVYASSKDTCLYKFLPSVLLFPSRKLSVEDRLLGGSLFVLLRANKSYSLGVDLFLSFYNIILRSAKFLPKFKGFFVCVCLFVCFAFCSSNIDRGSLSNSLVKKIHVPLLEYETVILF